MNFEVDRLVKLIQEGLGSLGDIIGGRLQEIYMLILSVKHILISRIHNFLSSFLAQLLNT
jgi:hypothetical protein